MSGSESQIQAGARNAQKKPFIAGTIFPRQNQAFSNGERKEHITIKAADLSQSQKLVRAVVPHTE